MPTFSEMNKKVEISIGLILTLVVTTFAVTSFYFEQVTLGDRMDKRYNRTEERIDMLESLINEILISHEGD